MGAGASIGPAEIIQLVDNCFSEVNGELQKDNGADTSGNAAIYAMSACENLQFIEEKLHEAVVSGETDILTRAVYQLVFVGKVAGDTSNEYVECLNIAAGVLLTMEGERFMELCDQYISSSFHVSKSFVGSDQIHYARALMNYFSLRRLQNNVPDANWASYQLKNILQRNERAKSQFSAKKLRYRVQNLAIIHTENNHLFGASIFKEQEDEFLGLDTETLSVESLGIETQLTVCASAPQLYTPSSSYSHPAMSPTPTSQARDVPYTPCSNYSTPAFFSDETESFSESKLIDDESYQNDTGNEGEVLRILFEYVGYEHESPDVDEYLSNSVKQTLESYSETTAINVLTSYNDQGDTLLLAACRTKKPKVVQTILEFGKTIRKQLDLTPQLVGAKNAVGLTPLHVACHADFFSYDVAEVLLNYAGASSCYVTDRAGCTPLHYAAATGSSELIALLLMNGASTMFRDKYGNLPAEYVDQSNLECLNLLYNPVKEDNPAEDSNSEAVWEKRVDIATDKIYFYNIQTGEVYFPDENESKQEDSGEKTDNQLLTIFTKFAWQAGLEGMLNERKDQAARFAQAQAKAKLLLIEKGQATEDSLRSIIDSQNRNLSELRMELSKLADWKNFSEDQLEQALSEFEKERALLSQMKHQFESAKSSWTEEEAIKTCSSLENEQQQRSTFLQSLSETRMAILKLQSNCTQENLQSEEEKAKLEDLMRQKAAIEHQLSKCTSRISSLTKSLNEALESDSLSEEMKTMIQQLLQREEKLLEEFVRKTSQLEEENWKIQMMNERLSQEKQAIEQRLAMERKELEEEARLRQAQEQKLSDAECKLGNLKDALEKERQERERAKDELARIQEELKNLSKERQDDAKVLAQQEVEAKNRVENSEKEFEALHSSLQEAIDAKAAAAQELATLKQRLLEEQKHKEKAKAALKGMSERLQSANDELAMLMKHLENEQKQRERAAGELSSVQAEMERLRQSHTQSVNQSEEQVARANKKAKELAERESKLSNDLAAYESDISRLNRDLMMANFKTAQAAEDMQEMESRLEKERDLRLQAMRDLSTANAKLKAIEDERRLEAVKWNMERSQNQREKAALEEDYRRLQAQFEEERKERERKQKDMEDMLRSAQDKESKLQEEKTRANQAAKARNEESAHAELEMQRLRAQLEEERRFREQQEAELSALRRKDAERLEKEKEDLLNLLRKEQDIRQKVASELQESNQKLAEERQQRRQQLDENLANLKQKLESEAREKEQHQRELEAVRLAMDNLERERNKQMGQSAEEAAKAAELEQKEHDLRDKMSEMEEYMKRLQEEKGKLYSEFVEEQALRKQYFNEIEDLKGRIRVFCRVRPLSSSERERECSSIINVQDSQHVQLIHPDIPGQRKKPNISFSFDACFGPERSQADIFADSKRVIQVAVDGYNVCVFAYGQTGSGKTYTLMGPDNQQSGVKVDHQSNTLPEHAGIATRSIHELFYLMERDSSRFTFQVKMYVVELYKEETVDLLFDGPGDPPPLQIHLDADGVVGIDNITEVPVEDVETTLAVLRGAFAKRKITATKMNSHSSRSHLISSLKIRATAKASGVVTNGKLTLVDLAGSERASKTGATGDTLKEAQAINKSLLALGDVIQALTTNAKHVPYRNHPLTQLMADSIGGNAKTLMFVNVSPADYNLGETKESLRWASRVKQVTNAAASKNTESAQVKELREQLEKLKMAKGLVKGPAMTSLRPLSSAAKQ